MLGCAVVGLLDDTVTLDSRTLPSGACFQVERPSSTMDSMTVVMGSVAEEGQGSGKVE